VVVCLTGLKFAQKFFYYFKPIIILTIFNFYFYLVAFYSIIYLDFIFVYIFFNFLMMLFGIIKSSFFYFIDIFYVRLFITPKNKTHTLLSLFLTPSIIFIFNFYHYFIGIYFSLYFLYLYND
jgi:hypothetical protein